MPYCCTRGKQTFPSSTGCKSRKCPDLIEETYPWGITTRKRMVCRLTGRIPGNMGKCPKEGMPDVL